MRLRNRTCHTFATLLAMLLLATGAAAETEQKVALDATHVIRFATAEQAKTMMGAADAWVMACSDFDRQVRVQSKEPVTQDAFLEFVASNVLEWDADEISTMTSVVDGMREKIAALSLSLDLPSEILLVQTTGREEGNVGGYTRGQAIIIPERQLQNPPAQLEHFMLHELFHVMTRHNPALRTPIYALIGFQPCGEIDYPKELMPRRVTNPDAFHFDACIELTVEDRAALLIPLTLSKSASYDGGGMFEYVTIEFLEVELHSGRATPRYADGLPILHAMGTVQGYMEKIGQNTGYIIHPEEIMADNFVYAVQQKQELLNPEIPAGITAILTEK